MKECKVYRMMAVVVNESGCSVVRLLNEAKTRQGGGRLLPVSREELRARPVTGSSRNHVAMSRLHYSLRCTGPLPSAFSIRRLAGVL